MKRGKVRAYLKASRPPYPEDETNNHLGESSNA
jgi:hypothetical protein